MKKLILLFYLICSTLFAQKNSVIVEKIKTESDSLIINLVGSSIFKNNFRQISKNTLLKYQVKYSIIIDDVVYKKIYLDYDDKGNLKTNKIILKKVLNEFINIKELNPKVSIDKVFSIAKKNGLKKINQFHLNKVNGNLNWSVYENFENRDSVLGININANNGKVIDHSASEIDEGI